MSNCKSCLLKTNDKTYLINNHTNIKIILCVDCYNRFKKYSDDGFKNSGTGERLCDNYKYYNTN